MREIVFLLVAIILAWIGATHYARREPDWCSPRRSPPDESLQDYARRCLPEIDVDDLLTDR